MPNNFTISHLTDLHLTEKDDDARSEPKLFGRLKGMNAAFRTLTDCEIVQKSDLLLFTGDITDSGNIKEWEVFWDILTKSNLKNKSLIVPGNHDLCCLGARLPQKTKEMVNSDLLKLKKGLAIGGFGFKSYPWIHEIDERAVILGLDSCNKGNTSGITNAIGKIGFNQLEKLARALNTYKDVSVKIIALHHSPNIPANKTAKRRNIEEMSPVERWGMEIPQHDRQAFRLLCITHKVRLVVHGHVHRREDRRVNGVRFIGAPASTQPRYKKYGFYTYEIQGKGGRAVPKLNQIIKD